MVFVGDYFAIVVVLLIAMFFIDRKHAQTTDSKVYLTTLILIFLNAVSDIGTGCMDGADVPLWANMCVNTLYFLMNILSTSCIAVYLFRKILEHSHNKHCMKYALRGLAVLLGVYVVFLVVNVLNGCLFYFDANNIYHRGPWNGVGYMITILQMGLVGVCYVRNRSNASNTMRRILVMSFPLIVVSIIIQRIIPEIILNSMLMALFCAVLFMIYNGQRPGVHALTRLNDRHRFFEELNDYFAKKAPFQIFMINIKNFGNINQKFGHVLGDELLYQFAFGLERIFKKARAFHMNGTVFALIIPCSDQHTAERNQTALLSYLESDLKLLDDPVSLDCVTVEYLSENVEITAEELYETLEYAASGAYRNKLRFARCDHQVHKEMLRRRYLIDRLRIVDREHGYQMWYQPIYDVQTGKFKSMEALIRLIEPDGSIISPAEFIPLAEQTGMFASITWFAVEEVCKMLRKNPVLLDTTVGINLPMYQMLDAGFFARFNSIINQYCIPHKCIAIEFTERSIHENVELMQTVMNKFVHEGYLFYLDDFGSGVSNFNCMLQLPFSTIKLDMNLIRMDVDKEGVENLGLVKTLTKFLQQLQLTVIAEGVETQKTADTLSAMGVDRIQGYFYARPMSEQMLIEFYSKH